MEDRLKMVLDKMAEIAGYDPVSVDWKSEEHLDLTWTKEQEEEYIKWLCDALYKDAKLRKELMAFPSKSKARIREVVISLLFFTGFTTIEDEKTV